MIITFNDNSFLDSLVEGVDKLADTARIKVVGDPVRVKEYERAQAAAQAFKDAGYAGDAQEAVACWATAKGWTNQQAADDILAASARWLGALDAIRALRLQAKESLKVATTQTAAQALYDKFQSDLSTMMQGVS